MSRHIYSKHCARLNFFKAFTLAEVLITLTIIGIIAAITVPSLQYSYKKQANISKLQKAYLTFNNVLKKITIDKGCVSDLRCTGLFATGTDNDSLGEELVKYFNTAKNCRTATGMGCGAYTSSRLNGSNRSDYDSDAVVYGTRYKFITTDGISYTIGNYANNCNTPTSSNSGTGPMIQVCGVVNIDIDNLKGDNIVGKDHFQFFITNNKGPLLYPRGGADDKLYGTNFYWKDNNECQSETIGSNGYSCTGRVIEENWQINYW